MPSTISLYAVLGVAPNATLAEIPTAACWPRDGRRRWLLLIFWISGPAPAPHSPPGHRADDAGGYGAPARCPFGYRNDGANTADAADCGSQHDRRHCRASSPDRPPHRCRGHHAVSHCRRFDVSRPGPEKRHTTARVSRSAKRRRGRCSASRHARLPWPQPATSRTIKPGEWPGRWVRFPQHHTEK